MKRQIRCFSLIVIVSNAFFSLACGEDPMESISEEEVAGFIKQLKAEDTTERQKAALALAQAAEERENQSALVRRVSGE